MLDTKFYGFVFSETEMQNILYLLENQHRCTADDSKRELLGQTIVRTRDTLKFWQGKEAPVISTADLEGDK